MSDTLQRLNAWYLRQCNGVWEHHKGITITSLDNPGWWVKIEVGQTALEAKPFEVVGDGVDENRHPQEELWMVCHLDGTVWNGACDPSRLNEVLQIFLAWAEG